MSVSAMSISLSGMQAASTRLEVAATNIANSQTEGFQPLSVEQTAVPGAGVIATPAVSSDAVGLQASGVDLASESVDVLMSKVSYTASLKALKMASDMEKSVVDLLS
jgi:flagellar basal-body rod protein FlgC